MFFIGYLFAELRRRLGRTALTALGFAVGIALVVAVSALSAGLDDAQATVLSPLTGVGTDMSVTRPLKITGGGSSGPGGFGDLSKNEQDQLQQENEGARLNFLKLGDPGDHFSTDVFVSTSQLSFPSSEARTVAGIPGVRSVAGGLTVSALHVTGKVPPRSQPLSDFGGPPDSGTDNEPQRINFDQIAVSGVDQSKPTLGAVTRAQISRGSYFSATGAGRQAILSVSYAKRQGVAIGDSISLAGKTFDVIGLASPPLGAQGSDVYVPLQPLQKLSARQGRVNVLYVRATTASAVGRVSEQIESTFAGSDVTTARDLADRVGGSLVDAKNLTSKLGAALEIVGLAAAALIAGLLTLTSIARRTREIGTLKAIGWSRWLVVRQVASESLAQGVAGGLLGALLGVGVAAAISAAGITLNATVASPAGGEAFQGFGQGSIVSGSTSVTLSAPVDGQLILLAVLLAVAAGLVTGAIGGLRSARLRPSDALRQIG